jgi:hypothetical protein
MVRIGIRCCTGWRFRVLLSFVVIQRSDPEDMQPDFD